MKVNFDQLIMNEKNEPIMAGPEPITLGVITKQALLNPGPGEDKIPGEEKFKRFQLAMKCEGEQDLKVDEVATVKSRIGIMCPPLIVGRCWDILETSGGNSADETTPARKPIRSVN